MHENKSSCFLWNRCI